MTSTLRISDIIASIKRGDYDEGALGDKSGFREGGPFDEVNGLAGATSVVFAHDCPKRGPRAIRVPHGPIPEDDEWDRMELVSEKVRSYNSTSGVLPLVDFEVERDAIWTESNSTHVITMPWIEDGRTLLSVARDLADRSKISDLNSLALRLEEMGRQFHDSLFDHGDISGGNILVTSDGLHLIDPDTLLHDSIANPLVRERGHISFAHPCRSDSEWEDHLFRFPLEVLIVSVRALAWKPKLVDSHGDEDSLLFNHDDLSDPESSPLFEELCSSNDKALGTRARKLRSAALQKDVASANKVLGPFHTPKPLPSNPIEVPSLPDFEPPKKRSGPARRRASLPLRIPEGMGRGS